MKRTCKVMAIAIVLGCLMGCGPSVGGSSAVSSNSPDDYDASGSTASAAGHLVSAREGVYVTTDAGIYELQTVFPASANIFYTDAETKDRIFLCAAPNCSHNNESCSSYISTPSASFPPMLMRVGDRLLVFVTEAAESAVPYAMTMNFDGSDRRTAFKLEASQSLMGGFCTDGSSLYFDVLNIDKEGTIAYELWQADVNDGHTEKIRDLGDSDAHYALVGIANGQMCFQRVASEGLSYCLYTLETDEMQEPFFVDSGTLSMMNDGYLFAMDETAHTVTRYDLETGETKTVDFPVKEGYGYPSMRYLPGGNLLVEESELNFDGGSYDVCAYVVDVPAGSCSEMTLRTPYNNRPVYALAEVGDLYYVATDYTTYTPTTVSGDGTNSQFDDVANVYAFISKEDYALSNSAGYRMVNDAFAG